MLSLVNFLSYWINLWHTSEWDPMIANSSACYVFCSETSDFVLHKMSEHWFSCIMVHLLIWPWTQSWNNHARSRQGFIFILMPSGEREILTIWGQSLFSNYFEPLHLCFCCKNRRLQKDWGFTKGNGQRMDVCLLIYLFICGNKMVLTFRWSSIF